MYICLCNAITDRQIKASVAAGATTLADLQTQLGVATCCGCCAELASSFLKESGSKPAGNTFLAIHAQPV